MVSTLDLQDLRQLNLFQKITKIRTMFCFSYNDVVIFCVPQRLVRTAVGEEGKNVRSLSQILKKRVKIVSQPESIRDIKRFVEAIVSPIQFNEIEVKGNEVVLTAGRNSKAALIGRDKRRAMEMQKIVKNFFDKDFRIV